MEKSRVIKVRRHLLLKNLILVFVTALLLIVATWTWFSNNKTVDADGISITAETPDNMELSLDGVNYNSNILKKEFSGLSLIDVTSDGKTFIRPQLIINASGVAVPNTNKDWQTAQENTAYISLKLYVRSKQQLKIYLRDDSTLDPKSPVLRWDAGTEQSNYNPSSYGNFSKDCIVGAARLSVLDKSNNVKLIWIPHPELYLDTSQAHWEVYDNIAQGDTYIHQYYDINKNFYTYDNAVASVYNGGTGKYQLGTDSFITELDGTVADDGYYYSSFTINVWVDGCDTEARRALSGGVFNINLKFMANKSA
ncbi:MAG TPA: hypothetical protein GX401_08960 [Clostridiales bacterium]|nr:hypothetical protein [Clostridiales bacterium]